MVVYDSIWNFWDFVCFPLMRVSEWISKRWYYHVVNRPHIVRLDIPVCYWADKDYRMLHANMVLLKEFVEEELNHNGIDCEHYEEQRKAYDEIMTIYVWWNNYSLRQKEIDNVLQEWAEISKLHKHDRKQLPCGNTIINWIPLEDDGLAKKEKELFDRHTELEKKLEMEEDDMLLRLMKIRRFMWT